MLSRASTTRRSAAIYPISQVLHAMHSSERHQRTKRTKLKRCLNFQMSEAEDEHEDELPRPAVSTILSNEAHSVLPVEILGRDNRVLGLEFRHPALKFRLSSTAERARQS